MDPEVIDKNSIKIVESIIEKFNLAIENIQSSATDQLENLISTFEDINKEDNIIQLTEQLIHKSESSNDLSIGECISNVSSVSNPKETSGWFNTWWSKVVNHKSSEKNLITSITSISSTNDELSADESALNQAKKSIKQLEDQGPAGLVHISALSNVVNRRILVWTSSTNLYHDTGKKHPGDPINIQFHSQPEEIQGHWTLLGNEDPNVEADLNDCLFATIAAQTGHKPEELRAATVEKMRKNIRSLAKRISELAKQEQCGKIVLMVGGARYDGKSANAAKKILDNSQCGRSHPNHAHGHPRGHASHPSASGATESAENYSIGTWKTAFLSRNDQDVVGHLALKTRTAQVAMERLNQGGIRQVVHIPSSQIQEQLPQGAHFNNGRMGNVENIKDLVLVLQHFAGHYGDPSHDVFVHTFYPRLN
ncbi:uncharacterized protein [Chelonus insularis]|uniref:uncharacterized protein n=1 Tax=Chelonus insularis TaxID=460826 RepID=UPI00158F015E|nr:uncharacterized protein LOC118073559 [Chelonus insularis]